MNISLRSSNVFFRHVLWIGLIAFLLLTCNSDAQWIGPTSGGTFNTSTNWVGGVVNGQFIGNQNVGAGGYGGYGATGTFTVSTGSNEHDTFSGNFVYENTDSVGFTLTPGAGTVWTFNSANPQFIIDMGGAGYKGLATLGAASRTFTLDFTSHDATFDVNPTLATGSSSSDSLAIYANLINVVNLNKTGGGTLLLEGGAGRTTTMTGAATVSGGALELLYGSAVTGTTPAVTGATRFDVVNHGSALNLHNTTSFASTAPLIDSAAPINLYGGALATSLTSGNSTAVGDVTLMTGRNVVSSYFAPVAGATLTLNSLTRSNDATVNFFGAGITTTGGTVLIASGHDANILAALVGGGGAAGTTNVSILPWATAQTSGMSSGYSQDWISGDATQYSGSDFVTYTSTGGFRALASSEYFNDFAGAGTTDNVVTTKNNTVSAAQTINSLKLNTNNATQTINSVLTLTSGGLIDALNINSALTGTGSINSGSNPLIVTTSGSLAFNVAIANSITDPSATGLILGGSGTTTLGAANTYGGGTVVQGNVVVANNAALPSATRLRLDTGAVLTVGTSSLGITARVASLSGTGQVNFSSASNQLNVGGAGGSANVVTVNSTGIVSPGDSAGATRAATLLLGSSVAGLTFQSGSFLDIDLAGALSSDTISIANAASVLDIEGGTLRISYLNGYTPTVGTSWMLTSGFGSTLGNASNMSVVDSIDGFVYGLSFNGSNLQLTLVSTPEPAPVALLLGAGLLLLFLARRKSACA